MHGVAAPWRVCRKWKAVACSSHSRSSNSGSSSGRDGEWGLCWLLLLAADHCWIDARSAGHVQRAAARKCFRHTRVSCNCVLRSRLARYRGEALRRWPFPSQPGPRGCLKPRRPCPKSHASAESVLLTDDVSYLLATRREKHLRDSSRFLGMLTQRLCWELTTAVGDGDPAAETHTPHSPHSTVKHGMADIRDSCPGSPVSVSMVRRWSCAAARAAASRGVSRRSLAA